MRTFFLTLLALFFAFRPAARAEVKNFRLTGTITSLDDRGLLLDGSVKVGDPFEGFYTFDTTRADSNADATVGDYRYTTPENGLAVRMGNYVFRTDPRNVDFLIETVNRPSTTTGDNYLIRSYNNVCSRPVTVTMVAWQLDNPSGTALTSDALPANPPNLAAFTQGYGFTVEGGAATRTFFVRGRVDAIEVNTAIIPQIPPVDLRQAVALHFPTVMGYFYQVQTSPDLYTWTNLGTPVLGDGTTLTQFVEKSSRTTAHFRAVITNQP